MDALPDDLVSNIFNRLSIKSIGVCICVNKKWRALIKKPSFVLSNRNIRNKFNQYLVFWKYNSQFELRFDNHRFDLYKLFTLPIRDPIIFEGVLTVNICNGVMCLAKQNGPTIMLWNPIIRKSLTLPKPNLVPPNFRYRQHIGFWFDSVTNDYKLIRIICFEKEQPTQVETFSLSENCWNFISELSPPWFHIKKNPLPVLNGTLHWTVYYNNNYEFQLVLGFDVNAKVFREIELPNVLRRAEVHFTLSIYKEASLAICCSYNIRDEEGIWVMKEYGNVLSWTKIWQYRPIIAEYQPSVFVLLNNGKLLGDVLYEVYDGEEDYKKIFSIDLINGEYKVHGNFPESYFNTREVGYFEESLVLLDNANAINL